MTAIDPYHRYTSAEFRLESPGIFFRFKLRRTEAEPLFALVPENSRSLDCLREGSRIPMTFYYPDKTIPPKEMETRIKYIRSTGAPGIGSHVMVALEIEEAGLN